MSKKQEKINVEEIKESLKQYELSHNSRISNKILQILEKDPTAPICVNCKHCQQTGFLFHCPLYELPEDGRVVGQSGDVYYIKGKTMKTYPNVPMKSEECESYVPITPFKIRE